LKQGFNLLKPQQEAPSVWTTIYKWIVGTARVVLIVTETAVIVALVLRIVIDVNGKNLDEKVTSYESVINIRSNEEKKYVEIQEKTKEYQTVYDKNISYTSVLNTLSKNIPTTFSNITLSISGNKLVMTGEAPNDAIQKMEKYLKNSVDFSGTKLTTLGIGEDKSPDKPAKFTFETQIKELQYRQLITDNQ
jgi:hypothetical protein